MKIKFKTLDGNMITGDIFLEDECCDEPEMVSIEINLEGKRYFCKKENYFEALQEIRQELEENSIQIMCNGAAVNVYPSPMVLNMGEGRRAYRLYNGKQSRMKDLVDIFAYDESLICVSVKEQEQFYLDWIKSLGV